MPKPEYKIREWEDLQLGCKRARLYRLQYYVRNKSTSATLLRWGNSSEDAPHGAFIYLGSFSSVQDAQEAAEKDYNEYATGVLEMLERTRVSGGAESATPE